MKKETKNVITREWVKKELHSYNKSDIHSTLVLSGALSLFFVPLTVGVVYGALVLIENVLLKILLAVVSGGILSAPVWLNLLSLVRILAERKMLLNGEFEIEIHTVTHKKEKAVNKHIEEFLCFKDFKDVSMGRAGTVYQLSSLGYEFYIVHYKGKKSIKLLYSTKMYEYKEA